MIATSHSRRNASSAPFNRFEGLCIAAGTVVSAVVLHAAEVIAQRHKYRGAGSP